MEKGRGIRTIIETIKKYYLYKGKTISINDNSKKLISIYLLLILKMKLS